MSLNYIHYLFLGVLMLAALAFAYAGKLDTAVAFGIAGTVAGVAIPTGLPEKPAETPPAPAPTVVVPPAGGQA